jgi:RNA polymerase sigma factor (sigma-70 family)
VPVHQRGRLQRWNRRRLRLAAELGRWPTDAEVAAALELKPSEARMLACAKAASHAGDVSDIRTMDPRLGRQPALEHAEARDALRDAIRFLPPRERRVMSLRFGLDGPPMTLQRIGEEMGIVHQQVSLALKRGLKRLRLHLGRFADADLAASA